MKRAAITLTMMAMAMTGCTGCNSDNDNQESTLIIDPVVPATIELTRAEREMVDHSNEFAFNLFRTATKTAYKGENGLNQPKSIIVSPISITFALGMLNNGAVGETQAQINKVLGFGKTGADGINAFCNKMQSAAPALDPKTKVMIANNIYLNKGYELKPDFVQIAKDFYNATPESRDFHDGKTMGVINQWAADHTEQMIKEVLNPGTFNPDAVSYLLNAIYFKGDWTKKFNKAETKKEVFEHAGYTKEMTNAEMMHQTATFEYSENKNYQALRLPYGNDSYQMTVLLPKAQTNALPTVPTTEEWQQLNQQMNQMNTVVVDVKLPRFESNTDIDLQDIMSALGMPDAFNPAKANFSNFCYAPTYIGLMKQVAKIKLDEEGSEAAAVTVIGMYKSAVPDEPEPKVYYFHANHPFLYVISERQTGAIFFIGQYTGY